MDSRREETPAPGQPADLHAGVGSVGDRAAERVSTTIDGPARCGFAYGRLPGHPEASEETVVVELADGGTVTLTIAAFPRLNTRDGLCGCPSHRAVQHLTMSRYLWSVAP